MFFILNNKIHNKKQKCVMCIYIAVHNILQTLKLKFTVTKTNYFNT